MRFGHVPWVFVLVVGGVAGCGGGEVRETAPASNPETSGAEAESLPPPTPAPPAATGAAEPVAKPSPAAEPAAPPRRSPEPPPYRALVTEVVKDYEAWKEVFDGRQDLRKAAGIAEHIVLLQPKAKAKVSVFLGANDKDRLEAFLADDERKQAMKVAGVKGAPTIQLIEVVEDQTNAELGNLASALLKQTVANYEAWKKVFDAHAQLREEAGLDGHLVGTAVGDDRTVYVYLQAPEPADLDRFLASKEFKAAMKEAGVKGGPEIWKFIEEEDETYP